MQARQLRPARILGLALLILGLLSAACSPEASRARGGGPGADIGNRGQSVDIHGASDIFYRTPLYGSAIQK